MVIVLVVVLIASLCISALASLLETAVTGCDFVKIETMADGGNIGAKRADKIKEKIQTVLTTMLFLNNVVNITATTVTTILVTTYITNIPLAVATATLTFIILIFCEITPKRVAAANTEWIVIKCIYIIEFVLFICTPFVLFLNTISNTVAKLLNVNLKIDEDGYSEEELKTIVDISHENGVLETKEKEIIQNTLEFGDKTLKQIMIPKEKMSYIDVSATYEEIVSKFLKQEYTRYPVVDETIDNVVGILNIKDFIKIKETDHKNFDLKTIMREPFFLNENVKISSAFRRMQRVFTNIVIVRQDNCKTLGIATLEDILEEVVGEIYDEFDEIDIAKIN